MHKIQNSPDLLLAVRTPTSVARYNLSPFPSEVDGLQRRYESCIESYSRVPISNFQNRITLLSHAVGFLYNSLPRFPASHILDWMNRARAVIQFLDKKIDILASLFRIFGTNNDFLIDEAALRAEAFGPAAERFDFTFAIAGDAPIVLRRISLAIATRDTTLVEMCDPLHRSYHNPDFSELIRQFKTFVNHPPEDRRVPDPRIPATFLNFMLYIECQPQADEPFLLHNVYTLSDVKAAPLERIDARYRAGIENQFSVGIDAIVPHEVFKRLRALGNTGDPAYLCLVTQKPMRGSVLIAPIAAQNSGWERFESICPLTVPAHQEPRLRGPRGFLPREGVDETLLDTRNFLVKGNPNRRIFVIDTTGMLYVGPHVPQRLHHSTMVAGRCVLAAGEIEAVEGKITYINNDSGHFKTTIYNLLVCVLFLRLLNVILPDARVNVDIYDRRLLNGILNENEANIAIEFPDFYANFIRYFNEKPPAGPGVWRPPIDSTAKSIAQTSRVQPPIVAHAVGARVNLSMRQNFENIERFKRFCLLLPDL